MWWKKYIALLFHHPCQIMSLPSFTKVRPASLPFSWCLPSHTLLWSSPVFLTQRDSVTDAHTTNTIINDNLCSFLKLLCIIISVALVRKYKPGDHENGKCSVHMKSHHLTQSMIIVFGKYSWVFQRYVWWCCIYVYACEYRCTCVYV